MNDDPEIFADNAEDGAMKALEEMEKRLKEVSDDRDRLLEALIDGPVPDRGRSQGGWREAVLIAGSARPMAPNFPNKSED